MIVIYFSDDAFNVALDLTSALTLIPFLLAAAYAFKLVLTRDTYTDSPAAARGRRKDLVIGTLATVYTAFLLYAAGLKFVLVSFIIYAPASVLFVMARREQGKRLFSRSEFALLVGTIIGAVVGIVALAADWISI